MSLGSWCLFTNRTASLKSLLFWPLLNIHSASPLKHFAAHSVAQVGYSLQLFVCINLLMSGGSHHILHPISSTLMKPPKQFTQYCKHICPEACIPMCISWERSAHTGSHFFFPRLAVEGNKPVTSQPENSPCHPQIYEAMLYKAWEQFSSKTGCQQNPAHIPATL